MTIEDKIEKARRREHIPEQTSKATIFVSTKLRIIPSFGYVVLELSVKPHVSVALADLRAKRRKFSSSEKAAVVDAIEDVGNKKEVMSDLRKRPGFEKVTSGQVERWKVQKPHKKRGNRIRHWGSAI